APDPAAGLPPARARTPAARTARGRARVPVPRDALDAFAQRAARTGRRPARARDSVPAPPRLARARRPAGGSGGDHRRDRLVAPPLLRGADQVARPDRRPLRERALRRLRLRAPGHPLAPAVRPRVEHVL